MSDVRQAIYAEVEAERDYQDGKWGGPAHDDHESQDSWVKYIHEYAAGVSKRACVHGFRKRMVKVAALAVAAIESYDRRNVYHEDQLPETLQE